LSLGARQDALALPELARAAAGRDTALRRAAYCALAESGLPDAIDVLVHAATIEPRKDSAVIAPNLLELARTAHARGNDAAAFKGYQALFALTDDTDLRLAALGGLADFPAAAGFEIAMEAARDEKLRPAAAGALAAAAAGCLAAGETARARQAFETLVRLDSSVGGLLSYASKVRSLGVEMDAAQLIGAIKTWWIVGPFTVDDLGRDWDTRFVGEPNIDLERVYDHGDNELAWRCVEGGGDLAMVNFIGHYGLRQSCFAYAYAAIEVPERQVAQLRLGTDDGVIAWVNGAKVHNHPVDRGLAHDNDIVPVRLEAGLNTILLRVSQGGGGWSFCARLTTQGGAPLESKQ